MVHEKTFAKKTTYLFLVPSQRYQDFCQLLQNLEFPKNVLGFSNHAPRFTPPYYLDVDSPFKKIYIELLLVSKPAASNNKRDY